MRHFTSFKAAPSNDHEVAGAHLSIQLANTDVSLADKLLELQLEGKSWAQILGTLRDMTAKRLA
jgi:hypothetical protein